MKPTSKDPNAHNVTKNGCKIPSANEFAAAQILARIAAILIFKSEVAAHERKVAVWHEKRVGKAGKGALPLRPKVCSATVAVRLPKDVVSKALAENGISLSPDAEFSEVVAFCPAAFHAALNPAVPRVRTEERFEVRPVAATHLWNDKDGPFVDRPEPTRKAKRRSFQVVYADGVTLVGVYRTMHSQMTEAGVEKARINIHKMLAKKRLNAAKKLTA